MRFDLDRDSEGGTVTNPTQSRQNRASGEQNEDRVQCCAGQVKTERGGGVKQEKTDKVVNDPGTGLERKCR